MTASAIRTALACDARLCACRRARSRVTHCPSHPDRDPSFTVDERDGRVLVICRAGCTQREVIAALRARGLWPTRERPTATRREIVTPLAKARRDVLREARRQMARVAPYREGNADARLVLACTRIVAVVRRMATRLGDCDPAWALLSHAAVLERLAFATDAALDEELAA